MFNVQNALSQEIITELKKKNDQMAADLIKNAAVNEKTSRELESKSVFETLYKECQDTMSLMETEVNSLSFVRTFSLQQFNSISCWHIQD